MGVFIIAEAGVNHNGCLVTALEMVHTAKECGADAIKFQTFNAAELVTKSSEKAEYQKAAAGESESQYDMLKKLSLDAEAFETLKKRAGKIGIEFMSTPFDLPSIDCLSGLNMQTYKIPSGEITNLRYLQKLASLNKKYIISTGMSDLTEVREALEVFYKAGVPKEHITILHANTQYPTPFEDVNLLAMPAMGAELGLCYGYSDHTAGIEVPVAAAALGASVIEKHFTLDRNMEGPDHKASLEPQELAAMVRAVRNIEKALGSAEKKPSPSESGNRPVARKSLVARYAIRKGELFSDENLTAKRPGTGISPMRIDELIGRPAERDYQEDELI